jgi:general secretion pathway protein G
MQGFTRQESRGVLSVIAMCAAIAGAGYGRNYCVGRIFKAKQAVIREDCKVVRQAKDSYRHDKGKSPASLQGLVQAGYLEALPGGFNEEDCDGK